METKQAVLPLSAPVSTSILLCFGNRHNHITVFDETVFVSSMTLYLQAMSLFIQSGLVGKHPKPFERAAPAGRSTSAVSILLTSTKSLHDTKPPDRDSARLRAFLVACGYFSLPWLYPRSDGPRRAINRGRTCPVLSAGAESRCRSARPHPRRSFHRRRGK